MQAVAISGASVAVPIAPPLRLRPCNGPCASAAAAGTRRRASRAARTVHLSVQAFRGVEQQVATVPVTFTITHKASWRWSEG